MKKFNKILCALLALLLLAAVFVGCDKDKGTQFAIELRGMNGAPISGATVAVTLEGKSVASGKTGADGRFVFSGGSATYKVHISYLPSEYILEGSIYTFEASADNTTLKLEFLSANAYNFTVRSVGGTRLAGVKITLSKDGAAVGEAVTNDNGVAYFDGIDTYDYAYVVSELPYGYYFADPADAEGRTGADKLFELAFPSQVTSAPRADRLYREGDIFFDFEMTDAIRGETYRLSELLAEKDVVLINFWNTSCAPCVSEMPGLSSAFKQFEDKAQVLAISTMLFGWDSKEGVRNFARNFTGENELAFPMFADGPNDNLGDIHFSKYISLTSLPTNVVIDRYGMIAEIDRGASGSDVFARLFAKYTADDYKQESFGSAEGEGGEQEPDREFAKPTVQPEDNAKIKAAVNGEGFSGDWYPETDSEGSEYSWPWITAQVTEDGKTFGVIKPSNSGMDYSFATINTKLSVSQADIDDGGKTAFVFDFKYSTEDWADYFYVLVNGEEVYGYTGTEHWSEWQQCYAFVADEPGEYEVTLIYLKDDINAFGQDTVYVKNARMVSASQIDVETPSLDIPRDATKYWNASTKRFGSYVPTTLGEDGFYHAGDANGPYILADLFSLTAFQRSRGFERNVSEATVAGVFTDASGRDMADRVTEYLMAANNSELAGLTTVTPALKDMLNEFAKGLYPNDCDNNAWLEFCIWFEHYGSDGADKGISTPERNPVRGLMKSAAIPMKQAHQGMLPDLTNIGNEYKNHVVIDRIIMPRGLMYSITPDKSGAYRFRSQSKEFSDTTAWLRDESMGVDSVLTEFGEEREDPDASWNFVITWYLEANKTYYLSVSLADVGGTGEFDFTTEYLGGSFFSWQAVSRSVITFEEGENGELGATKNYYNAYPVLADDGIYYDAVRNEDGTPKLDAQGNMTPDKSDPIYVDFLNGSRMMEQSIKSVLDMSTASAVTERLCGRILPSVFVEFGGTITMTMRLDTLNGGAELSNEDWQRLASAIEASYGEAVYIEGEMLEELKKCTRVVDIVTLLRSYYLNAFDFSGWQNTAMFFSDENGDPILDENGDPEYIMMSEYLGVREEDLKDYTSAMQEFLRQAEAKTTSEHSGAEYGGGFDSGCLKLTEELCVILKLFAQRYGWMGLHTDWMRLCYHYEYIGPYAA